MTITTPMPHVNEINISRLENCLVRDDYYSDEEVDIMLTRIYHLEKIAEVAFSVTCGHARNDCEYFSVPNHDMYALKKSPCGPGIRQPQAYAGPC